MKMGKKENHIRVVLCEPGKKARIITIENTLQTRQRIVQGPIEAVYPFADSAVLICNEIGKIIRLEANRALRDSSGTIYDVVFGSFLIVGQYEDYFVSLTSEQQQKYCKMFEYPEIIFRMADTILAIPDYSAD